MPPVRTNITAAAKPVKTERTHEENQERAYIAASRRSDRSLEARVESARRASEIHKRRTGRSLKVTEQDVVNEEMYEEEDDDLPMQYRRLTAHLQTTNADFDRRLAAYLTNHVAMRTALGQAVSDSYANGNGNGQYPGTPQFPNAMMNQFQPNAFQQMPNTMLPPQSPTNYRQSPYPLPNNGQQGPPHHRSASIATPQEIHGYANGHGFSNHSSPVDTIKMEDRRMSLPAQTPGAQLPLASPTRVSPAASRTSSSSNLANLKLEAAQSGYFKSGNQQMASVKPEPSPTQLRPSSFPAAFGPSGGFENTGAPFNGNMFSTALPTESQQLLGGTFDPNDPMTAMLMGGNTGSHQQPFYSYNPNRSSNKKSFNATNSYDGMNQTLSPGMLDTNMQQMGNLNSPHFGHMDGMAPYSTNGFSMGFDSSYSEAFKPSNFMNSSHTSGEVTPNGANDWQNLIDGNAWEDQTSSQSATA